MFLEVVIIRNDVQCLIKVLVFGDASPSLALHYESTRELVPINHVLHDIYLYSNLLTCQYRTGCNIESSKTIRKISKTKFYF